jgi:hypothetical protein
MGLLPIAGTKRQLAPLNLVFGAPTHQRRRAVLAGHGSKMNYFSMCAEAMITIAA